MSDRVTDFLGHDSIDRTAIIAAVPQRNLKRADIGRIGDQFFSRMKIVIDAIRVPVEKICWIEGGHLVEDPPFVPGGQRIGGVEQRIVRSARAGGGQSNQQDDEEATKWI